MFIRFFNVMNPLHDEGDASGLGSVSDIEALADTDVEDKEVETPEDEKIEDKEEESEEDKEATEEEDEEDLEEEEEETEVDLSDVRTTTYTDIKKDYPDFFKKFPDVRAALFRDEKYSEILGTPEDATIAVNKASALDRIEENLLKNGDAYDLLETINKQQPKSFEKIALDFLPNLQKMNKELYLEVAALPLKQLLRHAYSEGKDSDLGKAAAWIHRHFFNNLDFEAKVKAEGRVDTKETETEKKLRERLEQIDTREATSFNQAVDNSYVKRMTSTIRESLDKDDRLTEYTKSKLVDDILKDIRVQLSKDARYTNQLGSLFRQAKAAGYSNDFKSRVVHAGLARAKSLIPATRQKLVAEAIKSGKKPDSKDNVKKFTGKVSTKGTSSGKKAISTGKPDRKLTDMDILKGA
jgi:hypothetical protein